MSVPIRAVEEYRECGNIIRQGEHRHSPWTDAQIHQYRYAEHRAQELMRLYPELESVKVI